MDTPSISDQIANFPIFNPTTNEFHKQHVLAAPGKCHYPDYAQCTGNV
jgi:hypothetical protein